LGVLTPAGIQVSTSNALARSILSHDAKLHLLSIVDVPSIPLCLASGPSLDVSTDDDNTAARLAEVLLWQEHPRSDETDVSTPWWSHVGRQSDHGLLVKVDEDSARASGTQTTELLIYGSVNTWPAALPTPPASSSPAPAEESLPVPVHEGVQDVKVHALPLSSKILRHAEQASGLTTPPSEAFFLPYGHHQTPVTQTAPHMRQSLSSLFEDATQKRRRLKGRGGESISQAMANIDGPSLHGLSQDIKREEQEPAFLPRKSHAVRKGLSRASTVASFPNSEYSRPISRGALANGMRSSLHRVESAVSPRDSPTLSDTDSSYAQQNKTALAKVIMAGMRLHGLQQRRRPTKDERPGTATSTVDQDEGEDEYKLVYHQAFKAATFTFRGHFNTVIVSQEVMREVVDRLLTLFCIDPLAKDDFSDDFPGSRVREGEARNAFDLPSTGALVSGAGAVWSTPSTKRQ